MSQVEITLLGPTGRGESTVIVDGKDMTSLCSGVGMSASVDDITRVTLRLVATPVHFKADSLVIAYHDCPDCGGHGICEIVEELGGLA
jgi:hypothetical protein